jgi:hypothetical protein
MSGKRRRKHKRKSVQREYHHPITNRRKEVLKRPDFRHRFREFNPRDRRFTEIEDRRSYRQAGRRPRDIYGTEMHITLRDRARSKIGASQTKAGLAFKDPRKTIICRRRHERRQSLFALGRVGKGIKGPKYKRLNEWSDIKC